MILKVMYVVAMIAKKTNPKGNIPSDLLDLVDYLSIQQIDGT
ncbi:hypothetical protein [Siminovitchia terrae]|nr:hypothetical protein [Siminovitchia terrae]